MCLLIAQASASSDGTATALGWIIALVVLCGAGSGVYLFVLSRVIVARDAKIRDLMVPAKRRHALELALVTKKQEILHLEEEINNLLISDTNQPKPATAA